MASDSHLTIGDVIGQFGSPCGVSFYSYPNNGLVILHYPLAAMSAQASNSLSEDLPVQSITISTAGQRANLPIDPCGTDDPGLGSQYVNRPWRGFTSLKHYLAKGT
jgi:hypothetical protein